MEDIQFIKGKEGVKFTFKINLMDEYYGVNVVVFNTMNNMRSKFKKENVDFNGLKTGNEGKVNALSMSSFYMTPDYINDYSDIGTLIFALDNFDFNSIIHELSHIVMFYIRITGNANAEFGKMHDDNIIYSGIPEEERFASVLGILTQKFIDKLKKEKILKEVI